jgi:hypothetical protein
MFHDAMLTFNVRTEIKLILILVLFKTHSLSEGVDRIGGREQVC